MWNFLILQNLITKFVLCIDFFVQMAYNICKSAKGDGFMAHSSTTNISIRMDSDLKKPADTLFNELGMNISTAFNIFCGRQSGRVRFLLKSRLISQMQKRMQRCVRRKGLQGILLSKDIPIWTRCLQI